MSGTEPHADLEIWLREAERALSARRFRRAHELCLRVLKQAPGTADALFLLAMIAAEHGNFAKAIEVIERAIQLDGGRAEYYAQLGRCLIALQRPKEAFEAANRALACGAHDALTLDTIGVVMSRAGAHAEALIAFRRAVTRDASKPAYWYNLGAALQFVGELTQAEGAYRRTLDLDVAFYKAWSSLSQLRRAGLSTADVARLESALQRGDLEIDAELHLCHALAKHHEDAGSYAEAFRLLGRGKRRKRASLRYALEDDQALFETVQRVCTVKFCASDVPGYDSPEPIFIIGMPRSGTTLVERILASHPEVFAAGELTDFAVVLKRAARTPSRRVLDPETVEAAAHVDLARAGREYLESTRLRTGHTRHFIDKMPLNFFYAGFIHRALPRAKLICLRRNALDTCLSNYRQLFATDFPYYNYAYDLLDVGRYYLMFDALVKHWRAVIPNLYEIEYEAVVKNTEAEARRLVAFCGLDWDPACLRFHENAAPVATASSAQVRLPIYDSAIERWRKYENELGALREVLQR